MAAPPDNMLPPWRQPALLLPALAVAAAGLLALGLLVGLDIAYADRVYPGIRVLGTDLAGASRAEAVELLERRAAEVTARPLSLRHGDQAWTPTARELGVRIDVQRTLAAAFAAGRSGGLPQQFWSRLVLLANGLDLDAAALEIDGDVRDRYFDGLAAEIDVPPVDAKLTVFSDGRVEYRHAETGQRLDLSRTRTRVDAALLDPSTTSAQLEVEELLPLQTDAHLAEARATVEKIMASPMTAVSGDRRWTLDLPQLYDLLEFEGGNGEPLRVWLHRDRLRDWATAVAREVDQPAQDARFDWANGELEVLRPSHEGLELDVEAAADAVERQAPTDNREIDLPLRTTEPAVREDMRDLLGEHVRELIEEARTSFAGSVPPKRHNIRLAAERLNGVVVPPGALFSFNRELGPTTLDAGWQIGWGIVTRDQQARTVPSVAGGICQVATTLFHTVFWAGYQVEERNRHRYWIPAYTSKGIEGLDATVDEESNLDFRFVNTTDHYLLIQSWVDAEDGINFALYGTRPAWEVVVEPPVKRDVQPADPTPVEEFEPSLPDGQRIQVESARDGFSITVKRMVTEGDGVRTLELNGDYVPSRNVTMTGTGGRPVPQTPDSPSRNQPTPERSAG